MKIAVTSTGPTLEDHLDPRFGRCSSFLVVETDSLSFEVVENVARSQNGAGVQAARLISDAGARLVLTGICGPNAHQTLAAAGIGVVTGCSGTVRDAIEQYQSGKLTPADAPNVIGHSGLRSGAGRRRRSR